MTRFVAILLILACVYAMLPRFSQAFTASAGTAFARASKLIIDSCTNEYLVLAPPRSKRQKESATAVILLPGCQLKPEQYEGVAKSIQEASSQAVWIAIPKLPFNVANPLAVPGTVKRALEELQDQGYDGDKAFVGGHSLGGVFLPSIFDEGGLVEDQVLGTINLGCFQQRGTLNDSYVRKLPSLTMTGDLDGMVRTSRIAEDYHRNVVMNDDKQEEAAKLHHSVVLVEGMNHFGFVSGHTPFMKQLRDLPQEINHGDSVKQVARAIAAFLDVHQESTTSDAAKTYLLDQINDTAEYLRPLIEAMKLEGSKHVGCERSDGSPWASQMQKILLGDCLTNKDMTFSDESRTSWYLNPFSKVPFSHPKITKRVDGSGCHMETLSDPIYEKTDSVFDGGFFSNAVSELRCKFNSPQAAMEETSGEKVAFIPPRNFAKELNQKTIDWALENAPARVRRRYEICGTQLVPGDDISHNSGPGWIWSYLSYGRGKTEDGKACRKLRSHTLVTPTDHPIPTVGGKAYCKVLSPAKALDWMYTDSLRPEVNLLTLLLSRDLPPYEMGSQPLV